MVEYLTLLLYTLILKERCFLCGESYGKAKGQEAEHGGSYPISGIYHDLVLFIVF